MKVVLFLSYHFSNKTDLCLPLPQRFEKKKEKTFIKVNIETFL